MFTGYWGHLAQAFLSPRAALRRLMDNGATGREALELAALAFLLHEIGTRWIAIGFPDVAMAQPVGLLNGLLVYALSWLAVTWLAFRIGQSLGGSGRIGEVAVATGWAAVVTAPPLLLATGLAVFAVEGTSAMQNLPADLPDQIREMRQQFITNAVAAGFVLICLSAWLFACIVAEAHRFQQVWGTLAVSVGIGGVLLYLLTAAGIGAAPVA